MSTNPRQTKSLKKRLTAYIILLVLLISIGFLINSIFLNRTSLISPLGKNNVDSARVEKILREKNISFYIISVLPDSSYSFNIPNNGQVRLSSQKDVVSQISSLQRILIELTIEGKPFKSIDFRFSEPIISF